ncbi:MAG: succinate dehydrogenase/fumarate reductase iron-sulfur subunit [Betaproteobacteria bacterium]|nr:succinate dehydrogenase/fumarate reductase iron-sulfur subunit [Betaproteobacteria bacterium]
MGTLKKGRSQSGTLGTVKAKIYRYDPSQDSKPHHKEYEVPWKKHLTVLEVINHVYENYDPLAFDYGCRGRYCGRCAVLVNGKPKLACFTPIDAPGTITIKPLRRLPVIRDLVVDKSKMNDNILAARPQVQTDTLLKTSADIPKMDPEEFLFLEENLQWCNECLCCNVICPCLNEKEGTRFSGPAVWIQIALRHLDPKDKMDRVTQAVHEGLMQCNLCGLCEKFCPQKIKLTDYLRTFQQLAAKGHET